MKGLLRLVMIALQKNHEFGILLFQIGWIKKKGVWERINMYLIHLMKSI